jgi:hypothetical protein
LYGVFIDAGAPGSAPGRGLPIGNLTSQHFANFYLGAADRHALDALGVAAVVRYMDDYALFGPDKATVRQHAEASIEFLAESLHLEAKREATLVAPVHVGLPFLGFRIWPRLVRLDGARARRFRRRLTALEQAAQAGRLDSDALARRVASVVAWAEQADTLHFRRSFFDRRAACALAGVVA